MLAFRREANDDVEPIRRVVTAAFPTDAEARLVDALRASQKLKLSLVATVDGDVVGHVAFSPVTIDDAAVGWGLAPLAVTPQWQRQGVGRALVTTALEHCRHLAVPLIVVLGDPAYYASLGFVPAAPLGLQDSYGGGEAFQVIVLGRATPPQGLVCYAPEFAMFE